MRRLEEFSRPAIKAARHAEESLAAKFFFFDVSGML